MIANPGADATLAVLLRGHSQQLTHLCIQKPAAWSVGLHPLAIKHELGNGSLSNIADYFVGRTGGLFDIDLFKRNVVLGEECLRLAAVATPRRRIDDELHCLLRA